MERKIGEVFNDGEDLIEVVYDIGCNGCFFYNNICTRWGVHLKNCGECHHSHRSDRKSVKFIKIGESKMDKQEELKRSLAEEEQRAKDSLANVEKMKKQLEELNKKEERPTVSATGVYLNKISDNRYAYLGFDNEIFETVKFNEELETDLMRINNIFATVEQAEQEALRREGQEFIRRCAMLWNKDHDWRKKPDNKQHYIFWGTDNTMIECTGYATTRGDVQFDSKELADKCISELKSKYNEKQIKTIFGVK